MAIHLLGSPYGISSHSPFMANWPYPSPVTNMATSSSYGPFVFWGLHGASPQSRSHSGNLRPNGYFWSFPSKPGEMTQMAVLAIWAHNAHFAHFDAKCSKDTFPPFGPVFGSEPKSGQNPQRTQKHLSKL
ncbi:hypothetical protein O181_065770 [Austropuccinia psidii MF-1]|uniref:Uncharacterized protein n=1 Tax=Austropuccinia psidii MF-1 TaxID=1389203 RepID=A0A9Q3EVQ8_9BASI|nr:hypothetical protein [Austropuccinia psidii MF-1]